MSLSKLQYNATNKLVKSIVEKKEKHSFPFYEMVSKITISPNCNPEILAAFDKQLMGNIKLVVNNK